MKVALNLKELTDTQVVTLATTIIADLGVLDGLTPNPPVAALTTLRNAAQQRLNDVAINRQALTTSVTNKDEALDALRDALTAEAATVQAAANLLPDDQQQAFIEGAGMKVQATPSRVTELDPVKDLSLTASDDPGALDWHCDPVDHARLYVVEYTTDPLGPGAKWLSSPASTKSSGELTGLVSGTSVSIRVHAQGSRNVAGAAATAGPKTVP